MMGRFTSDVASWVWWIPCLASLVQRCPLPKAEVDITPGLVTPKLLLLVLI